LPSISKSFFLTVVLINFCLVLNCIEPPKCGNDVYVSILQFFGSIMYELIIDKNNDDNDSINDDH